MGDCSPRIVWRVPDLWEYRRRMCGRRTQSMIVPTLCVGMHFVTLRVTVATERPDRRYHAERGNDQVDDIDAV